jgi:hypothetical protein
MSGTCEPTWKCTSFFQRITRRDEIRGAQSELRVLAAAERPLARALRREAYAHSNPRLDARLARHREDVVQLLDFLNDEDHALSEPRAEQRVLDKGGVLVAVADDE